MGATKAKPETLTPQDAGLPATTAESAVEAIEEKQKEVENEIEHAQERLSTQGIRGMSEDTAHALIEHLKELQVEISDLKTLKREAISDHHRAESEPIPTEKKIRWSPF